MNTQDNIIEGKENIEKRVISSIFSIYANEIIEGLYLGSQRAITVPISELLSRNITNILMIGKVKYPRIHESITYLQIPLDDVDTAPLSDYIQQAVEFINSSSGSVLVNCQMGLSRSPSFVIAYLIIQKKMSFDTAFNLVQTKRPSIIPNEGFVKQLRLLSLSSSN